MPRYNLQYKPLKPDLDRPVCKVKGCKNLARINCYSKSGRTYYNSLCATHLRKKYGYEEKWLEDVKRHRASPAGRLTKIRGVAKKRGVFFDIDVKDFKKWFAKQKLECSYCGLQFEKFGRNVTIDKKTPSKGYVLSNIALACLKCNIIKNDVFTSEEMKEIATRYNLKDRYKTLWHRNVKEN